MTTPRSPPSPHTATSSRATRHATNPGAAATASGGRAAAERSSSCACATAPAARRPAAAAPAHACGRESPARDRRQALRAGFWRDGRRIARDLRPPLGRIVDRGPSRPRASRHRAAARVRLADGRLVRLRRRYLECGRRARQRRRTNVSPSATRTIALSTRSSAVTRSFSSSMVRSRSSCGSVTRPLSSTLSISRRPPGNEARDDLLVVVRIAGLVRVEEDVVERRLGGHRAQRLQRGPDDDLHPLANAGVLDVPPRDRRVLLVELEAGQAAAVREPAGDRDRAVAGERPELERPAGAGQPREHREQRRLVRRGLHHGIRHLARLARHALEHLVLPGMPGEIVDDLLGDLGLDERHGRGRSIGPALPRRFRGSAQIPNGCTDRPCRAAARAPPARASGAA